MKRPAIVMSLLLGGIILFNAGFAVYLRPLLYTLTPLQRYYLDAYLSSSWKAKDPAATTDIEWIWKVKAQETKAKDKSSRSRSKDRDSGAGKMLMGFAFEEDLVARPASELLWGGDPLPFTLSPQAAAQGWLAVSKGALTHANAAQLQPILATAIFDGKPAWKFFVQPMLALAAAFALWLLYRIHQASYLEQNWWKPVPLWLRVGRKLLASGSGAVKALQVPQAQLALPTPSPGPVILEQTAPQPKAKPAPKPAPVVPVPAPVQQAKPAAPVTMQPKPKATFWDESKGLD